MCAATCFENQAAAGAHAVAHAPLTAAPLQAGLACRQQSAAMPPANFAAMLQAGVSQDTLLYISSSSTEDDNEVSQELQQLLPRSAQAVLAHIAAGHNSSSSSLALLQQQSSTAVAGAAGELQPPTSSPGQQQQQQQQQTSSGSSEVQAGPQSGASSVPGSGSSSRLSRRVSLPANAPGVTLWGVPDQRFKGDLLVLLR